MRIDGITGTQLLSAVDDLKVGTSLDILGGYSSSRFQEDFYRNRMENHWLLPSISPILSLTAQELEKSRESSSIADTQAGDMRGEFCSENSSNVTFSAEDSSRIHSNEQTGKVRAWQLLVAAECIADDYLFVKIAGRKGWGWSVEWRQNQRKTGRIPRKGSWRGRGEVCTIGEPAERVAEEDQPEHGTVVPLKAVHHVELMTAHLVVNHLRTIRFCPSLRSKSR